MNSERFRNAILGRCLRYLLPAVRRKKIKDVACYLINKKPKYYRRVDACGITVEKRTVPIIVSLTSYPARIGAIAQTISSLLTQSLKPDEVVLWLAESQFPQREGGLPRSLLRLKRFGLTIEWCEDIRSYKKLIPAIKKFPDAIIVTSDDDVYYHPDWLKFLYNSYRLNPHSVHAHCVRNVCVAMDQGCFAPYLTWKHNTTSSGSLFSILPIGVGGILYPPHCFHSDLLNEALFMKLAPNADDLWFWVMEILAGTRITRVKNAVSPSINYRSSTAQALCKQNLDGGNNDCQLKELVKHYPSIFEIVCNDLADLVTT